MAKEIYLYSSIWGYTAEYIVSQINEAKGDLVLRVNTPGGSPEDGWGVVAKFAEYKGNKKIKVDGRAYSMGAFLLAYANDVEALDVSQFLLHRAAYASWIEQSKDYMTQAMWDGLKKVNASLRAALEAKIDVAAFEKLKGVKMDDLFSLETRIDVQLTAQEALQIGLIDKIVQLTPEKRAEVESCFRMAAESSGEFILPAPTAQTPPTTLTNKPNKSVMDIAKLKAEHPDVYNAIFKLGVTEERDRTAAWLVFADVDLKAVSEGITGGEGLCQKDIAAFAKKAMSAGAIKSLEAEAAPEIKTEEPKPELTAEQKELERFNAAVTPLLKKKEN